MLHSTRTPFPPTVLGPYAGRMASRWRVPLPMTAERAYVEGYNAGLAKADLGAGPVDPAPVRDAWRRGWREGDAAARSW